MDLTAARKIARAIAAPYARRFYLDAEEAEQIAWIAAWRALETHDAARSKINTWIARCVRLALSDWRRNSSEWGKGSPVVGCVRGQYAAVFTAEGEAWRADHTPPPWKAIEDADEVAAITRRAFGGDLLRRRYLVGESVADIAASLGVHPSAIDQRLRRAIAEILAEVG
jgi:DNA-directed RNA polymerase specialized sigma24 family protein